MGQGSGVPFSDRRKEGGARGTAEGGAWGQWRPSRCAAELYVNHNLQSCTVPAAVETGTQASGVSGVLTDLGGEVEVLGQGVFIPRSFSEIPLVCV